MGQYHKQFSIERREGFCPYPLGGGLKALEFLNTPYCVSSALAGLVCARGGNMPADLSQSTMTGRWAGTRVLIQGDYAEADDIVPWDGPALDQIYHSLGNVPGSEGFDPEGHQFVDIGEDLANWLEGVCSIRFFGTGWRDFVKVKQLATAGADGVGRYDLAEKLDKQTREYYKRCGLNPAEYQRAPRGGDWHGLRDKEVDQGQTRLLCNLNSREFIDPAFFGEVPTVGGIMVGEPFGSATSLTTMLIHNKSRGNGDMYDDDTDFVGRWRGGRILGTSEYEVADADGNPWPTTEQVRSSFTNISETALAFMAKLREM